MNKRTRIIVCGNADIAEKLCVILYGEFSIDYRKFEEMTGVSEQIAVIFDMGCTDYVSLRLFMELKNMNFDDMNFLEEVY